MKAIFTAFRSLAARLRSETAHGSDLADKVLSPARDPVGEFLTDRIVWRGGWDISHRALFEAYTDWCSTNEIRPWTETALGRSMAQRGYKRERAAGVWVYSDLALREGPWANTQPPEGESRNEEVIEGEKLPDGWRWVSVYPFKQGWEYCIERVDFTRCAGSARTEAMARADAMKSALRHDTRQPLAAPRTEASEPDLAQAMNQIVAATHGASASAGWWIDPKTGEGLLGLEVAPYVIATKLMLIVTELAEAMEGHRKGLMDDKLPHRSMIEVELADAVHRIADLAGAMGFDLGGALVEKMAFNAVRPDHKPGARMAAGGKAY